MAQQAVKLYYLNGKVLEVYNLDDSTQVPVSFQFDKNYFKKERLRIKEARKLGVLYSAELTSSEGNDIPIVLKDGNADRSDLYAAEDSLGKMKFYYFQDDLNGNDFSVEQMGFYVLGERDARYGVSGKAWFYSGLAVAGVSGYLLESSVWSLAVPPLFALTTKIPVISIKEEHISDQAMIGNEYYALGYEKQARSKNAIQALKGSALGTLLGIATFLIVDNN